MKCNECFMMAGTAKDRKYVPVHTVAASMTPTELNNIPIFHALTGCDTTSFIAGVGKRSALVVYRSHSKLLDGLTVGEVHERVLSKFEQFLVLLYKKKEKTCNEARRILFGKVSSPELLPPTSDAARLHILRTTYQAGVWLSAHIARPNLPDPCQYGWRLEENYIPIYTSLPAVPESCKQLLSCGCKSGCNTGLCKCKREGEVCTMLCRCQADCGNNNENDNVFQ
ncbi:uncharacterized protein LOC113206436 [Frankliniella occidentalis]|uniref:Uncharacterized protein LOC113206436 n=1 Tax=Frankliniella occidentalis TaxID=133901 RepID=A0A9C6XRB5_FRAOC|nr:uncharacterized protein LOC113206436 [Frankliniella occidentalis]